MNIAANLISLALLALLHSTAAFLIQSKDGTQLWAEARGNPFNPHVVWIHGFLSSSVVYDKLFEDEAYLSELYMVRYDLRGLGRSDKPLDPASYESQRFAEDFDAVVQTFGLKKPFVAGWSYGGTVCADIYTSHGHGYLSGCIYLASFSTATSYRPHQGHGGLYSFPKLLQDSDVAMYQDGATRFTDFLLADASRLPYKTRMIWSNLVGVVPQQVKRNLVFRKQDNTRLFDEGGPLLPVLYVEGSKDAMLDSVKVVDSLRPKFEKFEVATVPNGGHVVFLDRYKEVKERILRFVSDNRRCQECEGGLPKRVEL
ncbi:hypothetical protein BOTBODRAFT_174192 [Botryobasidium botryosum FD-172 SS1]|uniref:AB hydrolase-1 domain-containing protein n=1 Tax=Botryobasidium botryosum (strain FD-172 SS1) TaxID=930990 RepID=A0A067MHI6_BOTB1|nr:hypothetical protein BOTBODRAFT_174192 [Botryobasidium botryosum FD-172 SS1]